MAEKKNDQKGSPVKVERATVANDVTEVRVKLDEPVLDPNSDLAVQIPEGVGARGSEDEPLGAAYDAGTVEDQFREGRSQAVVTGDSPEPRQVRESKGRESKKS